MNRIRNARKPAMAAALAAAALAAVAARARADSSTWLAAPVDSNWANAANWTNGVVPGSTTTTTNTDTATFGASSILAVTVDPGRNLQNLTFTGPTGGTTTYAYAVSGSPLVLTSGGLLVATGANAGSTVVSAALAVQTNGSGGAYTVQSDIPGASRLLTVSGAVSGSSPAGGTTTLTLQGTSGAQNLLSGAVTNGTAGGAVAVLKAGTGTWSVNNTANAYTGGTTITGGTLVNPSASGTAVILGTGPVTLGGGTLRLSATSSFFNSALNLGTVGGFLSTKGDAFQPTAITGTGPLTIGIDSAAVFTPSTFQNYAGPINVNANSNSVTFRLGTSLTNFDPASLQNAALTLGAGVTMNRGFGTNGAQTVTVGSLAGVAGSFLTGGSGAGTGTFTYAVGGNGGSTAFAGTVTNGSTKTALTKAGTGTLTLTGSNSYTGGTNVSAGTLVAANNRAVGVGAAAVGAGAQLAVAAGPTGRTVLAVTGLTLAAGTDPVAAPFAGRVDVAGNDLDLPGATLATVSQMAAQGFAAGTWNGSGGLVSSTAAADAAHLTGVGVIQNGATGTPAFGDGTSAPLFDGAAVAAGDVLVKYTYYGDANLDGAVNAADYALVDAGAVTGGTGWNNGDFNYDGVVDGSDYSLMDNAFNQQSNVLVSPLAATPAAAVATAIPEPAGLLGGVVGCLAMARRRRPGRSA